MNALNTLKDQKHRVSSAISDYERNTDDKNCLTYKKAKNDLKDLIKVIKFLEPNYKSKDGQFNIPVVINHIFCKCPDYKGKAEDGTCYECRKPFKP